MAELGQADDLIDVEVLADLRSENSTQRVVGQSLEIREGVGLDHIQPLLAAEEDHVEIEIHPAGLDSGLSQDLEDVLLPLEELDVRPMALLDVLLRPPEAFLESRIIERGLELRRWKCRPLAARLRLSWRVPGLARLQDVEDPP